MNPILPNNIKKYPGTVTILKNNKYMVRLFVNGGTENRTFDTKEVAYNHKRVRCIDLGLPIKNILFDCGDYYEMKLDHDLMTKIDKDCLDIVDARLWSASRMKTNHRYAYAREIGTLKYIQLHNEIMGHIPDGILMVDHINHDTLDNRRNNLRIVNHSINNINREISKNNKSGVTGVYLSRGKWIVKWQEGGRQKAIQFSVKKHGSETAKQMAIDARKNIENTVPAYIQALNNA
jgi:hypothetical protein